MSARRLVPVVVLAVLLAGCASPQAELQTAVADLTDAANGRNAAEVVAQANEVITLAEQQRDRLGTQRADRIVELAQAVGAQAELLAPPTAPPPPTTAPTTPAPEPEPEEPEETEEPEPEPTEEPVETQAPEPEPTQEPVETQAPEPTRAPVETSVPDVEVTAPPADDEPEAASTQVAPAAASRTSPPAQPAASARPGKTKAARA